MARGRRRIAPAMALMIAILGTIAQARASVPKTQSAPDVVPGQLLVRFEPGTPAVLQQGAHTRVGARVVRQIRATGYQLVAFPQELGLDVALASYHADPSVAVAEPNYVARLALTPNDPCFNGPCAGSARQWSLLNTNAPNGWGVAPAGFFSASSKLATDPVTIAVLDTKIDAAHPDFVNSGGSTDAASGGQLDLAGGRDWIPASRQAGSALYHGTYVAGIAAAATGNGRGVAGVGYSARILPLTVVDGSGRADAASLADAIVYAWQRGARVINLSLGLTADSQAVHDAIVRVAAGDKPALVVAAAGNNTGSAPFYPGSYREAMSVSGTSPSDTRAFCSNYNSNVSVSAPAERVVSLAPMPGEHTTAPCGTSAATPQVSGLAALLFAQDSARTPAAVRRIIERSADDLGSTGRDDSFGWGRINIERALRLGDGTPATTLARATIPLATGGSSAIGALAIGARGIFRAELRFDSPSASPVGLSTADGSFGGTSEVLRGSIAIPASLPAGPHPFWVRSFDGIAWGPSTVGVVIVDRTPPTIVNVAATNGVRAAKQPVSVSFTASDAASQVLTYGIQVFATGTTRKLVFQDLRTGVAPGGQRYEWFPGTGALPGHYELVVIVADQAGNRAVALVGTIVV